jgi:hypothetical protein
MPPCQFMFSVVFVFQKSYTWNILGVGQNKSQTSYFFRHKDGVQSRDVEGPGGSHTRGWRGSPWPHHHQVWAPGPPSDIALPPIKCLRRENPKESSILPRKVPQHRRHRRPISGDKSLYSGTLPGRGISPGAISIDSTAISIAIADSHDEEGVVLPRDWGLYR